MRGVKNQQGIIQTIVIFILVIIILSLVGIRLSDVFKNETLKENFAFVSKGFIYAWDQWLKEPALMVWRWLIDLAWHPASEAARNAWGKTSGMFKR
ncbi:MAG: hypothetical protein AAB904_00430 [Patescibacteria group bacterium]